MATMQHPSHSLRCLSFFFFFFSKFLTLSYRFFDVDPASGLGSCGFFVFFLGGLEACSFFLSTPVRMGSPAKGSTSAIFAFGSSFGRYKVSLSFYFCLLTKLFFHFFLFLSHRKICHLEWSGLGLAFVDESGPRAITLEKFSIHSCLFFSPFHS